MMRSRLEVVPSRLALVEDVCTSPATPDEGVLRMRLLHTPRQHSSENAGGYNNLSKRGPVGIRTPSSSFPQYHTLVRHGRYAEHAQRAICGQTWDVTKAGERIWGEVEGNMKRTRSYPPELQWWTPAKA